MAKRARITLLILGLAVSAACTQPSDSAPPTPASATTTSTAPAVSDRWDADLRHAATAGDAAAVRKALEQGANVETRDPEGRTPLMTAVLADDLEVARALVAHGADPDARDNRGETPWVNTGVTGSVPMMELLLPTNPDLTARNRFGGNALIPAAEKGHLAYVREVLRQTEIDIDHINDLGWTALLEAVYYGDGSTVYQDIVRTLVDNGADRTIRDRDGHTAYDHALRRGFTKIADLLAP
ncbi:ankyrin repeat domain-containing protein [Nocardia sp. NPDC050406]|uniref:ankyrin repeat domain-containing protein n=1 Tax=Nocardia sp. NPDC050406 TaxID=3364318 RepID=UPI0037BD538A